MPCGGKEGQKKEAEENWGGIVYFGGIQKVKQVDVV